MKRTVLLCAVALLLGGCEETFEPLGPLAQQIEAKYGTPTLSIVNNNLRVHLKTDEFNLEALQATAINLQETAAYRHAFEVASFVKLHYEDAKKINNFIVVLDQRIDAINRIDFEFTFSSASLD